MIELDTIYNEDCLEGLKRIQNGVVDCCVTSPPYNVGLDYGGYNDKMEYPDYLSFIESVFGEMFRVLKDDGRMCVNIGDGKNGSIPTHSDFIQIGKKIGFLVLSTIIWNKNTTSNRTAWGSFMSPSSPSFPRCFEYILLFGKTKKLKHSGESTISKQDFIQWTNGIWTFTPETKDVGHPAPFPIELPKRLIELLTYKNDVIIDPFIGSGTTAIAAIRSGRHFIGFEIDKNYYDHATYRINMEQSTLPFMKL